MVLKKDIILTSIIAGKYSFYKNLRCWEIFLLKLFQKWLVNQIILKNGIFIININAPLKRYRNKKYEDTIIIKLYIRADIKE